MFYLSHRSQNNRAGVDQRLIDIGDLAIQITAIDFGYPSDAGIRTAERQKQLFDSGKSKCDGFRRKSRHQSGSALDFYAYVDGAASWNKYHLAMVAAAHLQAAAVLGIGLEWGGLWRSWQDFPHIQLRR